MWLGLCVVSWDSSEIKRGWDYVQSRGTAVKLNVVEDVQSRGTAVKLNVFGTMCRVVGQQ